MFQCTLFQVSISCRNRHVLSIEPLPLVVTFVSVVYLGYLCWVLMWLCLAPMWLLCLRFGFFSCNVISSTCLGWVLMSMCFHLILFSFFFFLSPFLSSSLLILSFVLSLSLLILCCVHVMFSLFLLLFSFAVSFVADTFCLVLCWYFRLSSLDHCCYLFVPFLSLSLLILCFCHVMFSIFLLVFPFLCCLVRCWYFVLYFLIVRFLSYPFSSFFFFPFPFLSRSLLILSFVFPWSLLLFFVPFLSLSLLILCFCLVMFSFFLLLFSFPLLSRSLLILCVIFPYIFVPFLSLLFFLFVCLSFHVSFFAHTFFCRSFRFLFLSVCCSVPCHVRSLLTLSFVIPLSLCSVYFLYPCCSFLFVVIPFCLFRCWCVVLYVLVFVFLSGWYLCFSFIVLLSCSVVVSLSLFLSWRASHATELMQNTSSRFDFPRNSPVKPRSRKVIRDFQRFRPTRAPPVKLPCQAQVTQSTPRCPALPTYTRATCEAPLPSPGHATFWRKLSLFSGEGSR